MCKLVYTDFKITDVPALSQMYSHSEIVHLCLLVFACLGFLSPANRGALMTCAVVLWVLLGTPAGYVAARFYKCE